MELALIEHEALKLSQVDRALLADRLLETLGTPDPRVMQAWAVEGERRLALFRSGEMTAVDGESAIASLRASLG